MKAPADLYRNHFKFDQNGFPLPIFEIKVEQDEVKRIVNYDHSAFIIPHLKKVDAWVQQQLKRIDQNMNQEDAAKLFHECEAVNLHAHLLAGQAYYLDTADRNSWRSIKQIILGMPASNSLLSSMWRIKDFVKAVDIEAYADKKNHKARQLDELSP